MSTAAIAHTRQGTARATQLLGNLRYRHLR